MAKPAKTKPVTAAELLNGPDGVGAAASGAAQAMTGTTDAASEGNTPGTAAATELDTSISGTVDPLVDKVDTGTAVVDMTAATATPSTGATSQDTAPGAAMLLTVPAAPTSGETNSLASPETPQLGAAAGDFSKAVPFIFDPSGNLLAASVGDLVVGELKLPNSTGEEAERRWFPVASPILRDGEHHGVGDPIEVTKDEHKAFRASQSITEEWDD